MVKERYQQLEEQSRASQRPVMLPSIRSFSYECSMPTHETEMERMMRAQSSSPPQAAPEAKSLSSEAASDSEKP